MTVEFFAEGVPAPAGSKRVGLVMRKDAKGRKVPAIDPRTGLPRTFVTDMSGKRGKAWREVVAAAGREAMQDAAPTTVAVKLAVTFYMPRPKKDYRASGELKPDAPVVHTKAPDTTKLLRGLEDALTGVVWKDDAQIVYVTARKVPAPNGTTGAAVRATWVGR